MKIRWDNIIAAFGIIVLAFLIAVVITGTPSH